MIVQSPLSHLSLTLSQVKASAMQYESTLKRNEAATRAVLVDPVLRALGWNTANTYMVEVERTLAQTRVDYALYDSNGDVQVIVEAKPLGNDLTHPTILMNLVTYAFTYGLQDIFLTDGLVWHHFTNFQPGNVAPSRILDLKTNNSIDCAAYLVQRLDAAKFWTEEQSIDTLAQQMSDLENIVSDLQKELKQLKLTTSTAANVNLTQSIQAETKELQLGRLIDLDDLPDVTGTKPTILRLPDDSVLPMKRWKDILRECCKFALDNNPNLLIPLPDRSGKKVNLLSTTKPAQGVSFIQETYNEQDLFIYTNYDANNSVANSRYILDTVPKDKIKVKAAVNYRKNNEKTDR
jgi:predicted type IV restriction endonuclease